MRTLDHRPRGFSLLELVIALTISLIVIAGAVTLMIAQQRAYQTTSVDRYVQDISRIGLGQLESNLRNAGYGVDPALTFDLGPLNAARMDRAPAAQVFATTSVARGDGTACAGLCRDSTTAPDEIAFYTRDPAFGPHPLTAAANAFSGSLTFAAQPGQTDPLTLGLQTGQVLQVVCYTGNMYWAYVTVSGSPAYNGNGSFTVPIAGGGTTFPKQNTFLGDPCFSSIATVSLVGANYVVATATLATAAEVFKVDRYHYFIQNFDAAGNVQPWNTANTRPYLMLDQGLRDANNQLVTTVVAPDVEDLQLEYIFPYDALNPLVGATAGAAIAADDTGINLAPAAGCPIFSDPSNAPSRQNHHPANIGAVRVAVVVRSQTLDPHYADTVIPASANRAQVAGQAGYVRMRIETTVPVPNLQVQSPYFPSWGSAGSRTLNVGGS